MLPTAKLNMQDCTEDKMHGDLIVEVPLRISLFGGGSDFPEFFSLEEGVTLNMAVSRAIKISISKSGSNDVMDSYRKESLHSLFNHVGLSLNGHAVKYDNILFDDFSSLNSGLGSSSALVIAVILFSLIQKKKSISKGEVAKEAMRYILERNLPQGIQDEIICALGGFRLTRYRNLGFVSQELPFEYAEELSKYLFLVPVNTPHTIASGEVLRQAKESVSQDIRIRDSLRIMRLQAYKAFEYLKSIKPYQMLSIIPKLGSMMREAWETKKIMNPSKITNPGIDDQVQALLHYGVLGCKNSGAGGRGYILCICYPWLMRHIQKVLNCNVFSVFPRKDGYRLLNC